MAKQTPGFSFISNLTDYAKAGGITLCCVRRSRMFGKHAGVRKFALIAFIATVTMLIGLWVIVWQHIDNERERTMAEAFREGTNLVKSIENQVRHIIDTADHDMVLLKMIYEKERYEHSIIDLILKQGIPICMPRAFASLDLATAQPSLFESTMTGTPASPGLKTLSHET